ncbi:SAM-dependent methyltransferase [Sandarakinorhabdus sp.]|uniref:SAM-dependent methyltransferase n=1 Tax=Sandarakinorhabdus sp. TaxID=1916663 RepID=UPI0033425EE4
MSSIVLHPIGHVSGGRSEAIDDDWGASRACILLDAGRFTPDALLGLDQFSHAEVIFLFDRVDDADITTGARHPRGHSHWPRVGIFAQRGKNRPNRLGIGVCRIIAVEGLTLTVEGLDAIDGTPVLDIKPVMSGFSPRGTVREPDWAVAIMADYW